MPYHTDKSTYSQLENNTFLRTIISFELFTSKSDIIFFISLKYLFKLIRLIE